MAIKKAFEKNKHKNAEGQCHLVEAVKYQNRNNPGAGWPANLAEQLNLPSLFGYFFGDEKSNKNTGA